MESTNIVFFFSVSNLFSCFFYSQRKLSDEFNTKLNLENQNEESDEKMHMEADYSSSSDSSSDDSDSEEEEGPMIVNPQPQPPRSTTTGGSRTLFAGNLALQVKKSDIKEFFQEAGEVVDVKFGMGRDDGSFRGFGHILFASPVEAQMEISETTEAEINNEFSANATSFHLRQRFSNSFFRSSISEEEASHLLRLSSMLEALLDASSAPNSSFEVIIPLKGVSSLQ
ncbi:hypothetical protein F2Q68_00045959 [Brassica cretica]|uniref:RRM domain-containing protein n=1 Tax=Brassica cretica TaxID=69181 RepID=A0A8S9LNI2_BRACR|nr:hypothetical protein F2Q68_00045959 [Brassica cretica]